jgi:hypothetical protein
MSPGRKRPPRTSSIIGASLAGLTVLTVGCSGSGGNSSVASFRAQATSVCAGALSERQRLVSTGAETIAGRIRAEDFIERNELEALRLLKAPSSARTKWDAVLNEVAQALGQADHDADLLDQGQAYAAAAGGHRVVD